MVPISGSAYTYAYATLGELVAWIIGWDLIIEYAVGNVAVAISWGNYFKTLRRRGSASSSPTGCRPTIARPRRFPGLFESAPHLFGVPIVFNILAFGIVALHHHRARHRHPRERVAQHRHGDPEADRARVLRRSSAGATRSPRTGSRSRRTAGRASRRARRSCSSPTSASTRSRRSPRKCRNPERDLPIGIIGSLIICTIIYIVVAAGVHRHHSVRRARHEARDRTGRAADDGAAVREHRALGRPVRRRSSRSDRSSRTRRCCSSFSSASRGSSSRWRATDCCRRASRKCIRASARRT